MHLIPVSCLPSGCELVTHQRLPTDQTTGHLALNQQPSWCVSTQLPSVSPHSPAPLAARRGRLLDSGQGNGAEGTCVFQICPQKHRALFHTLTPFSGAAGSACAHSPGLIRQMRTTYCGRRNSRWTNPCTAVLASQPDCSFQDLRQHFKAAFEKSLFIPAV